MTETLSRKDQFLQHFIASESALRGFIASVIFTPSDRDDVLQEVALRLWQLFDRYDASRPFTPWAIRVASLRMKEECRKAARRPLLMDESHLDQMTCAFTGIVEQENSDADTALGDCLESLPADEARLICGRYFSGHTIEELSQSHGLTPSAVYQSLCRLRRRLAACIRTRLAHQNESPTSTSLKHVL